MDPIKRMTAWERLSRLMLAFDSWVDSSLYGFWDNSKQIYKRYSDALEVLSLPKGPRIAVGMACEFLTIGTAGALLMLILAIPAFHEISEDWLRKQDLAVTFYDRYGHEIGKRGILHDDSVALEEFPDHLIKAVLATEDRRFYEHWGIDPIGTARALSANARASGVVQGGSTLTQQLAKNLFLNNERSIERKIKEAFLALWLEFRLSKNEILKLYLDRAYMGGGTFGASAAAEYYFGKSAKDVTLAEAAMLAGLFKAPTRYAPHVNLPAARARANDVLSNMVEAGFLADGQVQTAKRNPATPVDRKREANPDYFLDWAFDEIKKMSIAGKFGGERVLVVKTPLDSAIQKQGESALETVLRQHGEEYNAEQGALVVMDPEGGVRAMVGGRDYGASQFNRATDALRQPGSSFKPFVYAAAFRDGLYNLNSVAVDAPVCIGNWCPSNYAHSFAGSVPITVAMAKSINTIPVRMSLQLGKGNAKVGRAKIIDLCRKMGLTTDLKDTTSLPIGAAEVTVLDMTASYAVFANGGRRAKPYPALEVRNSHGDILYRHDRDAPAAERILPETVINDMNVLLSKVPTEGTGRRALIEGVPSAGKTGTTNAYRDAWYVGYTGNYVAGVWLGNDDYASTNNMTGGSLPAMTWKEVMTPAHTGIDLKPIPGLPPMNGPIAASSTPGQGLLAGRMQNDMSGLSKRSLEIVSGISQLFQPSDTIALPVPNNGPRADISPRLLGENKEQITFR